MPIRVVVADPQPIVLKGLEAVLSAERDFKIVAQCRDGEETLRTVQAHRPDILVLDVRMPGKDGLAVLRTVRKDKLATRVVFLVEAMTDEELFEATRLGVDGVVLKEMDPRLLVQCVRRVHAGHSWIERTSSARALQNLLRREAGARDIAQHLSGREIEIARMAARGLRTKAIGEALHISDGTVKTHLHQVYEKLNVQNRAGLIAYLTERGIL
jgi:two-component system, NarL family, nitrate/nitrite response regulator NarL